MAVVVRVMIFRRKRSILCENADTDAPRGNHLSKAGGIVLGPVFDRNEESLTLEADAPVKVSRVIAQLDCVRYRARFETHPSLRRRTNNYRTFTVDQKDSAVE